MLTVGLADCGFGFGISFRGRKRIAEIDDFDIPMDRETCASGDQMTHDDIFLEASEVIHATKGGRLREDAGGILERGC